MAAQRGFGTVYLDDMPLTGTSQLGIHASSSIGSNETVLLEDGTYSIPVTSEADVYGGYWVDLRYYIGDKYPGLPENIHLLNYTLSK